MAHNLVKLYYPGTKFPHLEAAWLNCSNGSINGTKADSGFATSYGPARYSQVASYNGQYPQVAPIGIPWMKSLGSTDNNRESYSLYKAGVYGLVWYDDTSATPIPPSHASILLNVGS